MSTTHLVVDLAPTADPDPTGEPAQSTYDTVRLDDPALLRLIRERLGQPPDSRVQIEIRVYRDGVRRVGHGDNVRTRPEGWDTLTEREMAIALLAGQGLTNRQIARRVFISPHTVNFHLRQIFRKLAISSRVLLGSLPDTVATPDASPERPWRA